MNINRRGFLMGAAAFVAARPNLSAALAWAADAVPGLLSFNELVRNTLRNRSDKIASSIVAHNALLQSLKQRGVVRNATGNITKPLYGE